METTFAARLDLNRILEQKVEAGFAPELALDLVLHEMVVRAAEATRAGAAALALARGDEMVCRAATGLHAPDLGVPLNTRDGLSGACLRTRQPQLCTDTESDPRVDSVIARRLGIRSILIVPVFDDGDLIGVLEVFSSEPSAFSEREQAVLEASARDCSRIRRSATELEQRPSAALALVASDTPQPQAEISPPTSLPSIDIPSSPRKTQPVYERWTLLLGAIAILATVGVSVMIGSKIGWLFFSTHSAQVQTALSSPPKAVKPAAPPTIPAAKSPPAKSVAVGRTAAPSSTEPPARRNTDELVVYDHDKIVFRMKPATGKTRTAPLVEAAGSAKAAPSSNVWIAPDQAESRLLSRVEPQYPHDALAAHRSGDVVLEVLVAEDGSVASIRTLSGDPLLASAAADAVRQWRYEPYRLHALPSQFQTEVTLTFALPN